jgi:tRNA nucleotidyltransferase (CCA-adding enzyme)
MKNYINKFWRNEEMTVKEEWSKAGALLTTLKKNGFESYVVGGAVRDSLLGREVADFDIVTTANPEQVSSIFPKTFQLSNEHQTIVVRCYNTLFEVTTIRGSTFEDDIISRDLTINSLAMTENGKVIDLVNGKQDLSLKQLRSIDPIQRMQEDPLRMLRVFRFVSELGFTIEAELLSTIQKKHSTIQTIAVERIVKEWQKLLKGKYRNQALSLLSESNLYRSIPGLSLHKEAIKQLLQLQSLTTESEVICWTAFCICMGYKNEQHLKQLAVSNDLQKAVKRRLEFLRKRNLQDWTYLDLYYASIEVAKDVEKVRWLLNLDHLGGNELLELWNHLPIRNRSELALNGGDLLKTYKKKQGPWVKEALLLAETLVVTGQCPNRTDYLIEAVKEVTQC